MTRAAIYARYSSDLQSAASIEDQVRLCKERAEREDWRIVDIYEDRATSGASLLRRGAQSLIQDALAGRFDVVLAESLDRLSRDQEDIAGLYKRMTFADVRLVTLAEGEISELHVGLKGTMSALFLKDLADKTRRGLRGRIEAGKSGGGNSYGYVVDRRVDENGEIEAGGRKIDAGEAEVVRRIFSDYAAGVSPRAIAHALNAEGVPSPSGKGWGASTIHGNPKRGTGILNNELYIGRLIWNRLRYVKDPETGKRVSRPNPESVLVTTDASELRIVDQELWENVKRRQAERSAPQRGNKGVAMGLARRPRYLLSGLLTCGCCGGGMSVISRTHVGCSAARSKGICENRKTIARKEIEGRVLSALQRRLMEPALFAVFCEEFTSEMNRLQRAAASNVETRRREVDRVERDLDRLVQALMDGVSGATLKAKIAALEDRKAELEAAPEVASVPKPALHPAMADVYRRKVEGLAEALNAPDGRAEAAEILRGLIDRVVLSPTADGWTIDLHGDLARILTLSLDEKSKTAAASGAAAVLQVSLVAGAGFEPATFRL